MSCVIIMVVDAIYIGRFQPFHNGHYAALKWILEREKPPIVLCIGSAQYSHTTENPFTVGERIEMIWNQLQSDNLNSHVIFSAVPDSDIHSTWVSLVEHYCPKFRRVYSNDPLTQILFRERGVEVLPIPFFNRESYEATKIRHLIANDEKWEHLVPPKIAEYIKTYKLDERIKRLFKNKK